MCLIISLTNSSIKKKETEIKKGNRGRAQILAKNVGNKRNLAIGAHGHNGIFRKWTRRKILFDNGRLEKSKRLISASRRVIITRIRSVELGYYKACTGVIRKKSYEIVHFLQSYDLFPINSDKGKVWVDIKLFGPFWTNQTIKTSKLIPYAVLE